MPRFAVCGWNGWRKTVAQGRADVVAHALRIHRQPETRGHKCHPTEKPSCAYLFLFGLPINRAFLFFAEILSDKVGWALAAHALHIHRQPENAWA